MSLNKVRSVLTTLLMVLVFSACGKQPTALPIEAVHPSPTADAIPTLAPTPTVQPTQTPFFVTATVWETDPVAPILLYHRFKTNRPSNLSLVSRLDFQEELEKLYASDYVSVSLEDWLNGDIRVPEGKRPLVLSMDDLFYRNQIVLTADGTPSEETGLGVSWKFSQEHPDFGFHWALFASLGDKPYGEGTLAEKELLLANVIVWCIEHDAKVYNHTFNHAKLTHTNGAGVKAELKSNDAYLRKLLALVGREDLIPQLGNLFALPFGSWPSTDDGRTAIYDYINPDGLPLQAIFEVDFITRPKFMVAPYAADFDRFKLPRMVANLAAVDYLVKNKDTLPTAKTCKIGPLDQSKINDAEYMGEQIQAMTQSGQCATGVYALENFIFRVSDTQVELIQKVETSQ